MRQPRLFSSAVFLLLVYMVSHARATGAHKKLDATINSLANDYRINIFYDYAPAATWKLGGQPAGQDDEAALESFVALLNLEFRKYPPRFVHSTHVGTIVLVKNLAVGEQRRAAVPDYGRQVLWLDFKNYQGARVYQRHIIHHEFYHLIDFELNHDAYWQDPSWKALNPPNFKYGHGGASAYGHSSRSWYTLSHPRLGFVNLYSTLGVEEDKAEIFACLFVPSERAKLAGWIKTDPVLRAKVAAIKTIVRQLDPDINQTYWRKLSAASS